MVSMTADSDFAAEATGGLDWRSVRAWAALLVLCPGLGLALGAFCAVGQVQLEGWLAYRPEIKGMQDMAVLTVLAGICIVFIEMLERPVKPDGQRSWWSGLRPRLGSFPIPSAPSVLSIFLVYIAACAGYVVVHKLLETKALGMFSFMFLLVAVFATLHLPVWLLRKLSGSPANSYG